MTLPLFHLDEGQLGGVVPEMVLRLEGATAHHIATVRRLAVGELVHLADGSGTLVTGQLSALPSGAVDVKVCRVEHEPQPMPLLVLAQALAKGARDEAAVEAATELGVDEVIPWQAPRSVVRWQGDREVRARRKWENVIAAATIQSRRARKPVLGPTVTEVDQLAARARRKGTCVLVLHESAEQPLARVELPEATEIVVVVGPEGGIEATDVETLTQAGATAVKLGPTILRSSSAGPAALAILAAKLRWQ